MVETRKMQAEERSKHLLRRLGFGASARDFAALGQGGPTAVLERLLAPQGSLELFDPLRFAAFGEEEDPFPGAYKFRAWWMGEMIASEEPLRDRMAIFWHDHFAASDIKVESGPIMLDYIRALRMDPLGRFEDILIRCETTVALLKELDVRGMSRKLPNENYAREVLELHTLGIGRYSEDDIRSLAEAFQGWSWFDVYYEQEATHREKMRRIAEEGREYHCFAVIPSLAGPKRMSLLHTDLEVDGFGALRFLARRPETRDHMTAKLWSHFAGSAQSAGALEVMRKAWDRSQGSLRETIRAMALHPDFASEQAVGQRVRSPLEYTLNLLRASGVGDDLRAWGKADQKPFSVPVPGTAWRDTAWATGSVEAAGMSLLYPPSVAGWDWGQGWISSDLMAKRMEFTGAPDQWEEYESGGQKAWRPTARGLRVTRHVRERASQGFPAMAEALNEFYDGGLSADSLAKVAAFLAEPGEGYIQDESGLTWRLELAKRMLTAAPEHHLH
jgi:hypothetical protein